MSLPDMVKQLNAGEKLGLTDSESKEVIAEAGILVSETIQIRTADEAVSAARTVGFPVTLDILSRQASVKTPQSLSIGSETELRSKFETLVSGRGPHAEALSICKVPMPGIEVMINVIQDHLFGQIITFGYGIMAVEVWNDVAYRILPLSEKDARLIVQEPKGSTLLQGYKGLAAPSVTLLEETLLKVSRLVDENSDINTLCLSPMYAYNDEVLIAKARIEVIKRGNA